MRNKLIITLILVLLISIQMTFGEYMKIYNVKSDMMLVFTLFLCVYATRSDLFFCGVVSGVLRDLLSSKVVGMYLITEILLCTSMYSFRRRSFRKDFFVFVPVSFVAFFLHDSIAYLLTSFSHDYKELFFGFRDYVLIGALCNTICAIVVFLVRKRKKIV